ncbi:cysteine-rich domain protein [Blastomonas sp. RAC04]|uniref:heterodisulfide reductase-related iron-sulfur binding cluster n=1 Tax=Blastomonas sp. RAC04 TaxID=1842535 RepID=UPI00083D868B|nr:heterodisulfide reductase-related iron-sulfur binding cluster [Blastomonas sp. RAC04]AOG02070.1 cysteine-rich domain protein [Blastomonas sp. RAC04]
MATGYKEGSLDAPTRHALPWREESWYDEAALDAEMRRVFDICHGCRRCFNLCDSFPKLFDMIDESPNEEVEDLDAGQIGQVVDACTLCDMCFMVKCPYVPPHEFDLDFPHLMLRYRAVEHRKGLTSKADSLLAETDRNGKLGSVFSDVANWAADGGNTTTRGIMQSMLGIDARAHLPAFADIPFTNRAPALVRAPNPDAPGFGRRVALYASCYDQFNDQTPGEAAVKVLAHNGVEVRIEHPECCGMPKLENGDIPAVASAAARVAAHFAPLIDQGYDVVAITASCALMMKFEWPLIEPDNADIAKLSAATHDISEYIVKLSKTAGLTPVEAMDASIGVHFACHSRAQNMGPKAMEMLKLIPEARPVMTERCSGHGGKWGIYSQNFDTAVKLARPTVRALEKTSPDYMVSECPLAGEHLKQTMEMGGSKKVPERIGHPVELMAKAYGL